MIVLDTNVVSELLRPAPSSQVEAWLSAQDGAQVYFTAVGEAELRHGVAVLPAGRRRTALTKAIEGILDEDFRGRILPFDSAPPKPMQPSPPSAALPAARSVNSIVRLQPSRAPMQQQWRLATQLISKRAAFN